MALLNKDGTPRKKKDSVCIDIPLSELENIKKLLPENAVLQVGRKWYDALKTLGFVDSNKPVVESNLQNPIEKVEPVQFNEVNLEDYS